MSLLFYAQPYDRSAEGFYFRSPDEYRRQLVDILNSFGDAVEEFEIQFLEGGLLSCELAKAWGVNQANLRDFFRVVDEWNEEEKIRFIIAVGECGYTFDPGTTDADDFDVDLYRMESLRDLAIEFVDEGLFGDIPERLQSYIDYDAIARDLSLDYSEAVIAGERLIYRCG